MRKRASLFPIKERDPKRQTEAQFMATLIQYASFKGWRIYHTFDSRHSPEGFPDVCMVRRGKLVFAELKRRRSMKPTWSQSLWLEDLGRVDGIEVYLWTPADWPEIEEVLK